MIQAEDLMIGDWVYLCTPKEMIPCQVTALDETTIWQEYYKEIYRSKNYKPIPLTEEILKKNGFNKHVFGFSIQEFRLYGNLPDNNLVYFTINFDKMEIRIDYVHQLQHALKLCGIEKEIIL